MRAFVGRSLAFRGRQPGVPKLPLNGHRKGRTVTRNRFTVGARLNNGQILTTTVLAESYEQVRTWLALEIFKIPSCHRPGVVLTCITGGKT